MTVEVFLMDSGQNNKVQLVFRVHIFMVILHEIVQFLNFFPQCNTIFSSHVRDFLNGLQKA